MKYSHIVDPATGMGLTRPITVTVVARHGIDADSWSTALSVLGPERGMPLIEKHAGTGGAVHHGYGRDIVESPGWRASLSPIVGANRTIEETRRIPETETVRRYSSTFISEEYNPMFDSLEERIRHDEAEDTTTEERMMKGVLVAILSTVVRGLYFAVRIRSAESPPHAHFSRCPYSKGVSWSDNRTMRPVQVFQVIPSLPAPLEGLRQLAYNLRWAWDHDTIELFRRLDSDLWESTGHNPVLMLGSIDQAELEAAAKDEVIPGASGSHGASNSMPI